MGYKNVIEDHLPNSLLRGSLRTSFTYLVVEVAQTAEADGPVELTRTAEIVELVVLLTLLITLVLSILMLVLVLLTLLVTPMLLMLLESLPNLRTFQIFIIVGGNKLLTKFTAS